MDTSLVKVEDTASIPANIGGQWKAWNTSAIAFSNETIHVLNASTCERCFTGTYQPLPGKFDCPNCPGEWAPSIASVDSVVDPYIA
jgi:hypothetical protein